MCSSDLTTILGAGYGMGAVKFKAQLKTFGTDVSEEEAKHIIEVYRQTYPYIVNLWREGQKSLEALSKGMTTSLGRSGVLTLNPDDKGIRLPNGLLMRYDQLVHVRDENNKLQFQYKTRYGWNKIYGGKVIENVDRKSTRLNSSH